MQAAQAVEGGGDGEERSDTEAGETAVQGVQRLQAGKAGPTGMFTPNMVNRMDAAAGGQNDLAAPLAFCE